MHLRGLVLFLLYLPGGARRSIRIEHSHHNAQQRDKTLGNGFEVSVEARETLIPGGSGMGLGIKTLYPGSSTRAGPEASSLRDGSKQDGRRAGHSEPHRVARRFRFGPGRAEVALRADSSPEEYQLPPKKESKSRRAALASGASLAAAVLAPGHARADSAVPTYSLKGIPGLSGLVGAGAEPMAMDMGVFGRGVNKDKSGQLNKCDGKAGCISTFEDPESNFYVPPWTYQPGYSTQAISASEAMRQKLREEASLEANGDAKPPEKQKKTAEEAYSELKAVLVAYNGKIVEEGDRYIRAEFTEADAFGTTDDVEFLISLDVPVVGYRSVARRGADINRQKNRIRDLRKALQEKGWKSVGRQLQGL